MLVGTISIEKSELVSNELTKAGIKHNVLNAKFHANEAAIVAQAGYPAAVTIATNMAGRGTDIVLGGSWQAEVAALENPTAEQIEKIKADWQVRHDAVLAAGGLHIIGTSVTNPVVSITSCAVVLVVRGMLVLPVSTCRWKMR